jgi:hypothetical protein
LPNECGYARKRADLTVRCHYRRSNLGRTASSIRSDVIFGKDRLWNVAGSQSLTTLGLKKLSQVTPLDQVYKCNISITRWYKNS